MQEKPATVSFLGPEQYLGSLPIPFGMSYEPGPGWIKNVLRCNFCFWRTCPPCLSCRRKDVLSSVFHKHQGQRGYLWCSCWNQCGCCSSWWAFEKPASLDLLSGHRRKAQGLRIPSAFLALVPYALKSSRTSFRHCKCQHPDDRLAKDCIVFLS